MAMETGQESRDRNFGRLALAFIPWALGLGAAVWFGVWLGIHEFRHELSQEERAAVYTGASERPKSKFIVQVVPRDCTKVLRADIDGDSLLLYVRNDCHEWLTYLSYNWAFVAPDGIVLKQGYHNNAYCAIPSEPGSTAECRLEIETDDRAQTLKVWTAK